MWNSVKPTNWNTLLHMVLYYLGFNWISEKKYKLKYLSQWKYEVDCSLEWAAKQLNRRCSWKIQRYCCLCIWVYQHVQAMLVAPIIIFIDRFSKVYLWRSRSRPRRAIEVMIQPRAVVSSRCFMNSTAFCSRVVLSLTVNQIHNSHMTSFIPYSVVRRSCCNLFTIEIIIFF